MTLDQVVAIICAAGSMICTVVMGALTFFLKRTLSELENADKKNAHDIKELAQKINDLKSDLPLVYTLREDFIRSMNSVDVSINNLSQKMDRAISIMTTKSGG